MEKYIIGKKIGMTQIFDISGKVIPVTVIEIPVNRVTQIKTVASDGYNAIQLGVFDQKKQLVNKAEEGHFKKSGVTPKRVLQEVRTDKVGEYALGQEIACDIFAEGDLVDVTANTKGRGTTGAIQRWNSARGRMSHGAGPVHRAPGSLGAHTFPARVFKNKHMAGHYGNEQVTIQNLQIVKVDTGKSALLVKGGIPGADGRTVTIKEAKSVRIRK
jgi:large subunit ribosomal protein L3